MSNTTRPTTKSAAAKHKSRPSSSRSRHSQPRANRTGLIVGAVVVVIAIALVAALAGSRGSGSNAPRTPASATLVDKVTGVPASVTSQVGQGSATTLPMATGNPVMLKKDGKPLVVYVGAEYCPYCAAERWGLVNALSRFGTFTNLQTTHSSSVDTFPSTPTFSFHGSSYSSPYVTFDPTETATNSFDNSGQYRTLDTPSPEAGAAKQKYDVPPYTSQAGSIPFIDFADKYVSAGASYSPQVLQGKSHDEIAAALSDPSSPIAQGVIGSANAMTATICKLTNNQPANVCNDPAITKLAAQLK